MKLKTSALAAMLGVFSPHYHAKDKRPRYKGQTKAQREEALRKAEEKRQRRAAR